jgi:hypothetical protein
VNSISKIAMGEVSRRIQHHPLIDLDQGPRDHASMSATGQHQGIFVVRG